MASLNLFFTPIAATQRRIKTAATAAKSSGGGSEEKGLLQWIIGGLQKQEQIYETDPILQKVEGKNGGTAKNSVVVPPKKKDGGGGGGFGLGGFFAKK